MKRKGGGLGLSLRRLIIDVVLSEVFFYSVYRKVNNMEEIKDENDLNEFLRELEEFKPSLRERVRCFVMKGLFRFEVLLGDIRIWFYGLVK